MADVVDTFAETTIARPRERVASFMFNPANDRLWTANVLESRPSAVGLLRPGMTVERRVRFLLRTFGYRIEVLDVEPGRRVRMQAPRPFEMRVTYELQDREPAHTVARIRAQGGGPGFFRLAAPLLKIFVRRALAADLRRLKHLVESSAA
jgi:hypothetical protein